ncbi:hypothetical protein B296_00021120 [Ensete ventricosum]|uniref:Uncharacterized protein n=1 Tax=Ensete ventricosum TaxID=4639 RepID=A0A427AQD1_ENSVE|nr:hypothetical protein B296_00021120 [Ensete ventricosum]
MRFPWGVVSVAVGVNSVSTIVVVCASFVPSDPLKEERDALGQKKETHPSPIDVRILASGSATVMGLGL